MKNTSAIANGNAENGSLINGDAKQAENDELRSKGCFDNFKLSKRTKKSLIANGIEYLFPVQTSTFNQIFEGKDIIVKSQTGSGKTFAFLLPILERIRQNKEKFQNSQSLILAPTRELAIQISECVPKISKECTAVAIYGGARIENQLRQVNANPTFLVCTPGRLIDMLENHGLSLDNVQFVVLDECDRMLDMGFLPDVDKIMSYMYTEGRDKPQTLIFSATVPNSIRKSIGKYININECETVDLVKGNEVQTSKTVEHIAMEINNNKDKASILARILQVYCGNHKQAIVFCGTKREADSLSTSSEIKLDCHVLHGDIPQDKREVVMKAFRKGRYRVLVTTDVAARVDYIHRSGRTGRAGRNGLCICLYSHYQINDLKAVERQIGVKFKRVSPPSGSSILTASASDAIKSLSAVPEEVRGQFAEAASSILETMDAKDSLAAALAVISGCEKVCKTSLLSGSEGRTTYVMKSNSAFRGIGLIVSQLRRILGDDLDMRRNFGKIMFTEDAMQSYFEIDSQYDGDIQSNWNDTDWMQMYLATEIPEGLVSARELASSQFGDGNNERSFGGERNGGGNFRGRDRGGFGRGGRGGRGGGRNQNNQSFDNNRKRQSYQQNGGYNSYDGSGGNKVTKLDDSD
ncbi:hypothetical protein GJ496_005353 [Pomphorhynchus laevis]|nr:hypothetical protein GJ496_005353 [Pomphorhynchus laevis]